MAIWNLGSINEDRFYRVPRLPKPGETLDTVDFQIGLGGKGANQSVAAARAGASVWHIGCVGPGGGWAKDRLTQAGINTAHVMQGSVPTGHANVHVDAQGENMIVVFPGANRALTWPQIEAALNDSQSGDYLLLQNETNLTAEAARMAREKGLFVVYSAAPFRPDATAAVLPFVDLLVLNEIEAVQLASALGAPAEALPVANLLTTKGAAGARWQDLQSGQVTEVPAFPVAAVDTTGAGDCFIGYTIAGLDLGLTTQDAMRLGAAASALKVTRRGTADGIPDRAEVDAFLAELET